MSVTQAANTLGISRAALHKAIQQKRLAAQRFGNAVLVDREAVKPYKRDRSQSGTGTLLTNVPAHAPEGSPTTTALVARRR